MNEGKKFENQLKESCKNDNIFCLRLKDSDLSFNGNSVSKFTATNPCDFIVFKTPFLFAVEAKSTKYKSIGIQRTPDAPEKMIKAHQINDLIRLSQTKGVFAGFIFNFRESEMNDDSMTYWMSIQDFSRFLEENEKESINRLNVIQYGGIIVEQKKKRVNYIYNMNKLLEDIVT